MLRYLTVLNIVFLYINLHAQADLELKPNQIEFKSVFDRLENVYFINTGNETLTIDSIYYRSDLYYVRFNKHWYYPVDVLPGDTLIMDCILSGFRDVASADSTDSMYVISNSRDGMELIRVKIDFYDDRFDGTISGYVTDGSVPVPEANVYFLYEGSYITKSAKTDAAGFYSVNIPDGRYTVAASKDSFQTTFFGQRSDPFNAGIITLNENYEYTADIQLKRIAYRQHRVSGGIFDSLNVTPLRKAMIVGRKGRHTPRKINAVSLNEDEAYTVFADIDGTFNMDFENPGYYYIQSFSDYFLPSYYKSEGYSSVFWEQADSVYVSGLVTQKNIYLPRDSSYGGGVIEGLIIPEGSSPDTLSDILVFAQSVENNILYGYTFTKEDGKFRLINLPYGTYRLFAQKIGYENFYSDLVIIDSSSTNVADVKIHVPVVSVGKDFVPDEIHLYQNYPNPFNPSTTIQFSLPSGSDTKLTVVNILGEQVKSLYEGYLPRGTYDYSFNAENLSTGTYFVILQTNNKTLFQKILLLK
ncbi:MAG: carboxypeptidase regulatory-like domain-containing protein [Ignavibacteriaceae bacterium]